MSNYIFEEDAVRQRRPMGSVRGPRLALGVGCVDLAYGNG